MKIFKCCLLAMLCANVTLFAQESTHTLTVGEIFPATKFTNVYNTNKTSLAVPSATKLTILDFWASWCGSCLSALPKIEHLGAEFREQVEFIMVNDDSTDRGIKLDNFFSRWLSRTGKPLDLQCIVGDTGLANKFPHHSLPHYVWLNDKGRVMAITDAAELNAANITKILSDGSTTLKLKDDLTHFNSDYPLLVEQNGEPSDFVARSILTKEQPALGFAAGQKFTDAGISRIYRINYRLKALFQLAYNKTFQGIMFFDNDIPSLDVNEKYCYEWIGPLSGPATIERYIQEDLHRYFNAGVKIINREKEVYVLTVVDSTKSVAPAFAKPSIDMDMASLHKFVKHASMESFVLALTPVLPLRILDETNIKGKVSMDFPFDILNFSVPDVQAFLSSKGYSLTQQERKVPVAVIVPDQDVFNNK